MRNAVPCAGRSRHVAVPILCVNGISLTYSYTNNLSARAAVGEVWLRTRHVGNLLLRSRRDRLVIFELRKAHLVRRRDVVITGAFGNGATTARRSCGRYPSPPRRARPHAPTGCAGP